MRHVRSITAVSLPVLLALAACTPAEVTSGAGSSHSPTTAASAASPGGSLPATREAAASSGLRWADGSAVEWGKPIAPSSLKPSLSREVAPEVEGSTPLAIGFLTDKVLTAQSEPDAYNPGMGKFSSDVRLASESRLLYPAVTVTGIKPGQMVAAGLIEEVAIWAQSPSDQAGSTPWGIFFTVVGAKMAYPVIDSDDVGGEPLVSTRLAASSDRVVFTVGMGDTRTVIAAAVDGSEQSLVPSPGAEDVWAAGGENSVVWLSRDAGTAQIQSAVVPSAKSPGPMLAKPILTADADAPKLALVAAAGEQALVSVGERLAVLDLYKRTLREVQGIAAKDVDPSMANAGGGRAAVRLQPASATDYRVLMVGPSTESVRIVTLPAGEGPFAVGANQLANVGADGTIQVAKAG